MHRFALGLAAAVSAAVVFAQDVDPAERADSASIRAEVFSRWSVSVERSKMDDVPKFRAMLLAIEPVTIHGRSVTPTLVLRCSPSGVDVVFFPGGAILETERDDVPLRIRVGSSEPVAIRATRSTNYRAAFINWGKQMFPKLVSEPRLLVEFTPYQASPVVAEFAPMRISEHAADVETHCGINLASQQ